MFIICRKPQKLSIHPSIHPSMSIFNASEKAETISIDVVLCTTNTSSIHKEAGNASMNEHLQIHRSLTVPICESTYTAQCPKENCDEEDRQYIKKSTNNNQQLTQEHLQCIQKAPLSNCPSMSIFNALEYQKENHIEKIPLW